MQFQHENSNFSSEQNELSSSLGPSKLATRVLSTDCGTVFCDDRIRCQYRVGKNKIKKKKNGCRRESLGVKVLARRADYPFTMSQGPPELVSPAAQCGYMAHCPVHPRKKLVLLLSYALLPFPCAPPCIFF